MTCIQIGLAASCRDCTAVNGALSAGWSRALRAGAGSAGPRCLSGGHRGCRGASPVWRCGIMRCPVKSGTTASRFVNGTRPGQRRREIWKKRKGTNRAASSNCLSKYSVNVNFVRILACRMSTSCCNKRLSLLI